MEQQRTHHRKVKVGTIIFEPRFNRPVDRSWVEKLKRGMDLPALGTIELWQTEDGCLICIDGQHRVVAVSEVFGSSFEIPAKIHTGISFEEAAGLFRRCNVRRHLRPLDSFRAGEAEGDPEVLGIIKILGEHGLRYEDGSGKGAIRAINQLQAIYRIGPDVLSSTLDVLTKAWGPDHSSYQAPLIHGLGLIIGRHKDTIDFDRLRRNLAGFPGGAQGFVGSARGRVTYMRGSLTGAVVDNAIAAYNKGMKGAARLPAWRNGTPPPPVERLAPPRSHHKAPAAKAQPARWGATPSSGTLGARIKSLLAADPLRLWTAGNLVDALKAEGIVHADDPEAAMRTLLTRLVRHGKVARPQRGYYGAVPSR